MYNWRLGYIFSGLVISLVFFIMLGFHILVITTPILLGIWLYSTFTIHKIYPANIRNRFRAINFLPIFILPFIPFVDNNDKSFLILLMVFLLAVLSLGFLLYESRRLQS